MRTSLRSRNYSARLMWSGWHWSMTRLQRRWENSFAALQLGLSSLGFAFFIFRYFVQIMSSFLVSKRTLVWSDLRYAAAMSLCKQYFSIPVLHFWSQKAFDNSISYDRYKSQRRAKRLIYNRIYHTYGIVQCFWSIKALKGPVFREARKF